MLNMDFTQSVVINTQQQEWIASPKPGVWRKPLAREEAEQGHATSLVRYDPGSSFSAHGHPKGEEIFVLEGVFSDEHGDFPAGTYFRNPPGSSHSPYSKKGCTLFVKLHQFAPGDTEQITLDSNSTPWLPGQGNLQVMPLHDFETEHTALVKWPKGEQFVFHRHVGGEEIYVISGVLADEHGEYPAGTWLRNPHMSTHTPFAIEETLILVKVGHLGSG